MAKFTGIIEMARSETGDIWFADSDGHCFVYDPIDGNIEIRLYHDPAFIDLRGWLDSGEIR